MILALALGTLAGEMLDFDGKMEQLGLWLKSRADRKGDSRFVQGFVTASLVVCIGAMAIVGSIQDGLTGSASTLYTKSILDFMIVMIFASTYGKGAIFSALPVGVLQGAITLCAGLLSPLFSSAVIANLSLLGDMLIFCVGINLSFGTKFKVANMLPALVLGCGLYHLGAASALLKLVRLKILLAAFQSRSGNVISRTFSFIRFLSCHRSLGLMSHCGKSKILKKFPFFHNNPPCFFVI